MSDYDRIASVIQYLDEHHPEQPDLTTLARHVGLSPYHFHRLFSRWAGITPKDFLQCLTLSHAKGLLLDGESVLGVALEAGLSGPSRLHDLCVSLEAATPGELKSGGDGWTIRAGFADTPFGTCLIGESPRGICHLSFVEYCDRAAGASALLKDWPRAGLSWDDAHAARIAASLFAPPQSDGPPAPLRAYVRGSVFQVRVWRALLHTRKGTLVSYGRLATAAGGRAAARAVGTAVGKNPLAYLIPCHRVIRETGALGEYRWGRTRKAAILAWEGSSRTNRSNASAAEGV
jgi:AraC family transcriptional regulator, regulatory protein of adaptative response / methylated-DNA-[protein]-cysteine methyltransferase